ncbi:MAG: bacterial translation initiation factor 2 (bIF-2), partial [Acidimicrobiales bacterium]|nr:bacterial translation initiation factor 2 (bIF-2) [Acidimicrobiales bacterium]
MAKRIRVYELARELGLTNKEALDLAEALKIGVKSHSSSIEDAQADRVRRKADAEGLRRDVSPEEPAPAKAAKKTAKKAQPAAAKIEPAAAKVEPAPEVVTEPAPEPATTVTDEPLAPAAAAPAAAAPAPAVAEPSVAP